MESVVTPTGTGTICSPNPTAMPDALANLGPLARLAGRLGRCARRRRHPVLGGAEQAVFIERYQLDPIDFQTNGPQLFYGLRYHTHIHEVGKLETFHDQVGYWLWEPATNTVVHTLTIPRGQVVVAGGMAEPDASEFEVSATVGICASTASRRCRSSIGASARCAIRMRVTTHHRRQLVVRLDSDPRDARSRRALRTHRQRTPSRGLLHPR